MSKEQELIDICFSCVLTATSSHPDLSDEFKKMMREGTSEERAKWVAEKLRASGFDTTPLGASWGVLNATT